MASFSADFSGYSWERALNPIQEYDTIKAMQNAGSERGLRKGNDEIVKKSRKLLAVLVAAVWIWIQMSTTAVLAAEPSANHTGGRDTAAVAPESDANAEEPEIEYFDELKTDNHFSTTLFIAGGIFILIGVGGFVGLLVWHRRSRHRDHSEEDKARILNKIQQAEQRVREQRRQETDAPLQVTAKLNLYDTQENDFAVPQDTPIVPTTPVSMQPKAVRPRVQPVAAQPIVKPEEKPAAPQAAEPAEKPIVPQNIEQPAAKPAAAPAKYDLEDILREVQEGRI